ncbi:endonuclease/exonuclease/phosphatase family protein [Caulobacter sp. KR2-114]|uniref:endonuclease/exonuclease/phosphatase family protein n=1 Tax=Caulobacter sp. KR2-114 TaxID=3400912 RepID=UPI003BFDC833
MTRIMTYNVHRCVGTDGRLDVGRVAEVIARQRPDIVALQEVDVGRARTRHVDQAHELAHRLDMAFHFNAALTIEEERYGDAILTRLPERRVKSAPLPGHPGHRAFRALEPRGALWLAISIGGQELQVINTHLGLVPAEQAAQAAALAGHDWLGHPDCKAPTVLVGDLNAVLGSRALRRLLARLQDARALARPGGASGLLATFPSRMPLAPIDHILVSPGVVVRGLSVPRDRLTALASDHAPLVMDFDLPPA